MLPQVSTAEPWPRARRDSALHVAFTYAGLAAMEVPEAVLASFPHEFREGMAARAERLGDRGPSAPAHWDAGLGTGEAHALVTVYGVDQERLDDARAALKGVGAAGAIKIVHEQRAAMLDLSRDHFGFYDGIAQSRSKERRGAAARRRPAGRPRRLAGRATGEFLHGYEDEDGRLPVAPGAPLDRTARSPSTASCTWTSPRSGAS